MSTSESDGEAYSSPDSGHYDVQPVTGEGGFYALDGAFGAAPFCSTAGLFDANPDMPRVDLNFNFDFDGQSSINFDVGSYQGFPLFNINLKSKLAYSVDFKLNSGTSIGVDKSAGRLTFKVDDTKLSFSTGELPGLIGTGLLTLQTSVLPGVSLKFGALGQPSAIYVGPKFFQVLVTTDGSIGARVKNSSLPISAEVLATPSVAIGSGYFARDVLDAFLQLGSAHLPPGM